MKDIEFFRDSATECRRMARHADSDSVRWELLLWAREFDRMAGETKPARGRGQRQTVASFLARFAGKKLPWLEAAD